MIFRWLDERRHGDRRRPARNRTRAHAEEVEPRLLLAADAAAGLLSDALPAVPADAPNAVVRIVSADDAPAAAGAQVEAAAVTEVVFVDAAVPDAQELVDAIVAQRPEASLRIVLLDSGRDAFTQIGETLAELREVSTLHLVAHGEPGAILLSGARVDAAAVDAASEALVRWREALTAEADLLLYGCDVAATPEGMDLLARLAHHTGADIAASDDTTGAAALGGDWVLEAATGSVEARVLFADGAPQGWEGVLGISALGSETLVNTNTAGPQQAVSAQRSVAVAADGSSVVVWQDASGEDGAGTGVFAQRFDAAGAAVGGQFVVSTTTSGDQGAPEIAMLGSGSFIVTWTSMATDGDQGGIHARWFAADGSATGAEVLVNTVTAGHQSLSSVAVDGSGNAVIVWQSQGEDGSGLGIYARRFDAFGNPAGAAFAVNTTTASDQEQAKVAMDTLGGFAVVWQSTLQDGDGTGVVARRFDALGNALTGELLVNQTFAGDQALPDVAIDANGFVVTWMSAGQDGDGEGIYARRYDAVGDPLAAEFRVNDTTVGSQEHPQVARTAGGGFVVAWQSFGQDGDQTGVFMRQYGANGVALTGEIQVNTTTAGDQGQPSLAVNGNGALHLVWTSNQDGSEDVWMRRFALTEPRIVIGALTPDTAEDGSTGSFTVALATAPANDVTVTITISDPTEAQASVLTLVFTAADWSTPQPVTLTGRADGLVDGPTAYMVTLSAASSDGGYQGLSTMVAAVNADIDTRNTITVTTVADTADGDTSSLAALLADRGADGEVSLREALLAANATVNAVGGPDRIVFDIAGAGPHVIALGSALPTITDAVVIDGSSEPDFAVNGNRPVVVLDGEGRVGDGLTLSATADGSTIHGLVIRDFGGSGIVTESGSDGHLITGNYIGGLDTLGQLAPGQANTFAGIWMAGAGSTVGGVTPDLRNVISNNAAGVVIGGASAVGNVVIGNAIGVAADGSTAAGNLDFGVVTSGGATGSRLGGTSAGEGNLVAYSGVSGVVVDGNPAATASISILGNLIFGNGAIGIDLMSDGLSDGVTANDAGDLDTGGNERQNFPVLLSAVTTGTTVAIRGELASTANTSFRVEFYNNPPGTEDPSGHGEGRVFLFATEVTTDGTGLAAFDLAPVPASVAVGDRITATATVSLGGGLYGGTSEFATNLQATAPNAVPVVTTTVAPASFTEDGAAVPVDPGLLVTDAGGVTLVGATVRLSVGYVAGEDLLGFVDQAGITGAWNADTGILTLSGSASVAAYQAALRSVTYTNLDDDPDTQLRTIAIVVDDGTLESTPATRTLQVVSINDAPITAAVSASGAEDAATIAVTLSGTDPDGTVAHFRLVDLPADGTLYLDAGLTTLAAISTEYAASAQALTLYFVPDPNWNGTSTFSYVALDDAAAVDATPAIATLFVSAVNDAPVLDAGGTMAFMPLSEDAAGNAGQTVASLIASAGGDRITDIDAGALEGIAITSASWSDNNGWFEYSLNTGADWTRIVAPSASAALLLRADDLIRFVPQGYEAETASITFRAWDRSSGLAGGTADTTLSGGTTAFSITTRTVAIVTEAVNDAPVFGAPQPGASRIDLTGTAGSDKIVDAVLLADGSLLTVGHGWTVSRFAADGSVIGVYAGGGIASGSATGIALQTDGRFVVIGTVSNGSDFDIGVRRHNADGSLDTGFGVGGLVTVDLGGGNAARGVAIQSDGNILVAGTGGSNLRVIRLDGASGTLDAAFGSGGIANVDLGSSEQAADLALDASGHILVVGTHAATGGAFLARLTTAGALDSDFGTGGYVTTLLGGTSASPNALLVQADGRIVLVGESVDIGQADAQRAFGVARFTAAGVLDTSFGGTGVVRTDFEGPGWIGEARAIAQQADGRLVVVGAMDLGKGQTDWAIVRYDTDGGLDAGFDGDGRLTPVTGRYWNDANAVAIAADGTIVVAGGASYTSNPDSLVMRFETDGTLRTALQSGRLDGTPSFVEGGAAVVMDADVRVFDRELIDANLFAGATLTLVRNGGADADDVFGATGLLGPLVEGGPLVYNGVTIGTVTGNSGGTLLLSFGAGATGARVNGVLNALSYAHAGDTPPATVRIDWTFDDGNTGAQGSGGALATIGSVTVSITATDDPPSDIDLASPAATNLLVNGSFETGSAAPGTRAALASLPGWTPVGGGVIEVWNAYDDGGPGAASDGQSLVELDHVGGTVSGIAQTVVTTAGQVYLLSFDFASRTQVAASGIEVYWRGERIATASQAGTGWRTYGVLLTGSGGADELRLMESAASDDGAGSLLDDVRLVATQTPVIEVPENSANGTVVARAGAADPEGLVLEGLGYTLVDDAGGRFSIHAVSGLLTVADGSRLDREATPVHLVTVRVTDGTGLSRDEVFTIALTDVPEVPVLETSPGSATFTENATAVVIDAALTVTDPDSATLVGASVRIADAYANGEDLLAFTDQSGIVGVWDAGSATLTLSGVASVADYQAALRSVTYSNTSALPSTAPRTIAFVATDPQGGSSVAVTRMLGVIAVNDAPTGVQYPGLLIVDENAPTGTVVAPAPIVDDPNPGDEHTFVLTNDAGGAFTIDVDTGAISVADASRLDFESAASMTVVVRVEDSGGLFHDETVTITLRDVNEAPVNTLPSDQYTAVDTALVFGTAEGRPLAVADVDGDVLRVTLTVTDGTLTLSGTTGLVAVSGANGSSSMRFTGSQAAFAAALEGMRFDPSAGWRGLAELTVVTEDLAGGAGGLVDTDRLRIHVGALVVTNASDLVNGDTASLAGLAADDGGDGISLREAILAANASVNGAGGPDRIHFQIPDALVGGAHLIELAAALPTLTDAVVIDGGTDTDWAANGNRPVVVIDGNGLSADGIVLGDGADGSTLRGLVIRDFDGSGIRIDAGSEGHLIEGNFIGALEVDGTDAGVGEANTGWGLLVRGADTTVGGTTLAAGNLIAGNASGGLLVTGADATGNRVSGNLIGAAADGITVLGNDGPGVLIAAGAAGNTIGSAAAGGGNLIVGHAGAGIALAVDAGAGNALMGNLIRANTGLGIDLGDDGLDPIDAGDADDGPNDRQNAPVVSSVWSDGVSTTITATLDTTPLTAYRIEFFSLAAADAHSDGSGGVRVFLGAVSLASDVSGRGVVSAVLPAVAVGDLVTATVTVDLGAGAFGSSSEFALNRVVTAPPPVLDLDGDDSAGMTGGGYRATFTEGDAPVAIADVDAVLTDPDSTQFASMRFTLAARPDGVAESLTADTSGSSIIASWAASTGVLTLSGLASVDDYRQVLGTVAYLNTSENPANGLRSIAVRVTDDTGNWTEVIAQVLVVSVADAPVITSDGGGVTANLAVAENTTAVTLPAATDPDTASAGLSWSITGGADAARFVVDPVTGALAFAVAPDAETPTDADGDNRYEVLLTVSDGVLTDTQALSVTVTDLDEFDVGAIVDTDGGADAVAENAANGTAVGVTVRAVDADATATVAYSLVDDAGGRFAIDALTGVVRVADGTRLDAESAVSHAITVRASSSDGSTRLSSFTIAVGDLDEFDVGAVSDTDGAADVVAENAANGTTVGLTVRAVDADVTATVGYTLLDDAGGRFTIDALTGVVRVADGTRLDAEAAASHAITVRASSSDGSTATAGFTIAVADVNEFPVGATTDVDAAPDAVAENAANGTAVGVTARAFDPDASATVAYALVDDAGGRFAIDALTGVVRVADGTRLDAEAAASHAIVIRASASDGSSSLLGLTIAIDDLDEFDVGPVTDIDAAANTVDENAADGTVVGLTARAVDADATATLTYSLADDAGGRFAIDALTGVVTVADGRLLDAETSLAHAITVRAASSDGSTSSTVFTIAIGDLPDSGMDPPVDTDPLPNGVLENAVNGTTVGLTALAIDPDATAIVSYSLNDDAGGRFSIDAVSGVVRVADGSRLDADTSASHTIVVRASSNDGSVSVAAFTIQLGDVDEFDIGPVGDADTAADSVDENSANGTVVGLTARAVDADATATVGYALDDDAGGRFAIDALTGVVTVADGTLLDAEAASSHAITVRATSSDGSTATRVFTIAVADRDEFALTPPVDTDPATDTVPENAADGTTVGIVVSASDADAGTTVTYALDDDAGGRFAIDSASGVVTVADGSLLDAELAAGHTIVVRASSSDGGTRVVGFTIAIGDIDEFDIGPVLDLDPIANSVMENAADGTGVGLVAAAVDADATATVTYSLVDDAGGRFAIDPTTGVVTVADGSRLDAELAASHTILVRALSNDGSVSTAGFTIAIGDVDEAAVSPIADVDPAANAVPENAADGSMVGVTARASDPDATATVGYALDDDAGGRFAIDAVTGVVTVADGSLLDADTVASHTIVVRATSSDGSSSTLGITVSVLPLNDLAPVITSDGGGASASRTVAENQTAVTTVTGIDPDLPPAPLVWSIVGGADAARFTISAGGALSFLAAPDFELPTDADADNIYQVIVGVSDGLLTDTQTISVTVEDIAEAPDVVVPGPQAVDEDTLLSIAGLGASDVDGDLASVQLAATRGTLAVDLAGGAVLSALAPDMRSLTLTGSQAQLAAALATVRYQGLPDAFGTDVLTLTAIDASGLQRVGTVMITVAPVNDPAVLLRNLGLNAPERGTIVVDATQLDVADVDDPAADVQIRLESAPTAGRLQRDGAILVAGDSFTQDDVDNGRITYRHRATGVFDDSFVLNASDGEGIWTGSFTVVVHIDAVNDAPQLFGPARVTILEDTPFRFSDASGTRLFATDDAEASALIEVRVSVDAGGALTLSGTSGLVFLQGDGRDDAAIVFRATLFAANRALDGLLFTPPTDGNAPHTLSLSIDDLGSTGTGGALSATTRITIAVTPVNDPPTIAVPAPQRLQEDSVLSFGPASGNRIVIGDVDAAGAVRLSLSVDDGTLELGAAPGLRFLVGGGGPTSVLAVEGSVTALQAALDGLRYLPPADFSGQVRLGLVLDDGAGGVAQASVPLTVSPVADPTDAIVPGPQTLRSDGTLAFGTASGNPIVLFDADDQGAPVFVRLSVPIGRLTIAATDGLVVTASGDGGAGGTVLALSGPMSAINAGLQSLRYTPVAHMIGATELSISIESADLNGDRSLRVLRSVSIIVSAVGGGPEFGVAPASPPGADGAAPGVTGRAGAGADTGARSATAGNAEAAAGPVGQRLRMLATNLIAETVVPVVPSAEALALGPPAVRGPMLTAEGSVSNEGRQGAGGSTAADAADAAERTVQFAWMSVGADAITFGMPEQGGVADAEAGVLDALLDLGTAVQESETGAPEIVFDMNLMNSARAAGLVFTAAAVWWTIYGGTTLWILVAAGPLARNFDPLQVLWHADADDADDQAAGRDRADALFEDDDGEGARQAGAQHRPPAINAMVMPG